MSFLEHAKLEMDIAGIYSPEGDGIDDWVREAVYDLLETLSKHETSGATNGIIVDLFAKLAKFEILSPITGIDEEWCATGCFPEDGEDELFQNKRCSHVFKNGVDGKPYDIDGRVFVDQDGVSFTSPYYNPKYPERSSTVYIEFPYTPNPEYVKVFCDYDKGDADFEILEDQ